MSGLARTRGVRWAGAVVVALVVVGAGLGTAAATTPREATATRSALSGVTGEHRPTAVGIARDGTTYVGFAASGTLLRLDIDGHLAGRTPLDRFGSVDGLHVGRGGRIWVDYGDAVSLLTPHGRVLHSFELDPAPTCRPGEDPGRYGGLATGAQRVYVADECDGLVRVLSRRGDPLLTLRLPGGARPRGIAYGAAYRGLPASLYVALPDRGQLLRYDAETLTAASFPAARTTLRRPAGGSRPQPAGVTVDAFGQVTVTDVANQAVYLLDG
ncbi:MAG: hypothetical protein ACXVW0_15300, partial [Nocardioides sp.]